jgi:transposase
VDHIGIDLHKKSSQICILTAGGELIEQRIPTTQERFAAALGKTPKTRILVEASTESEWAARCLEQLGHEVIVADPNYAPMYAQRTRKVKTDRRDARALAEACRLGAYRPAHRTSDAQQHVRAHVAVREALVQTRCKYVYLASALLRRQGLRWSSGGPETFPLRVGRLSLPETLQEEIAPLLTLVKILTAQIQDADRQLVRLIANDPRAQRLCTVPGVGPVTAATFVATIDRVERFAGAHQVEAYLGLVPRELSSGEKQCRGRITKAGNGRARWLLVEAAWSILRYKKPETLALRRWAERIATRRGKTRAAVALARRLAGIMFAMLRDNTVYLPEKLNAGTERRSAA